MVGGSNLLDGPVGPPQPSNNAPALAYSGTQQAAHSVHSANHMLRDLLGQSLLVPGMASSNPLSWGGFITFAAALTSDTGPLWILQDQDPLDFLNVGTGATAVAGGDGSVPSLVHGGASPERVPPAPQSRVPSPPNPAASDNWRKLTRGDVWSSRAQQQIINLGCPLFSVPKAISKRSRRIRFMTRTSAGGSNSGSTTRYTIESRVHFVRWLMLLWLTLQGPVLSILDPSGSFIMPSSLWTVNTLISRALRRCGPHQLTPRSLFCTVLPPTANPASPVRPCRASCDPQAR